MAESRGRAVLEAKDLARLLEALESRGYEVVGPKVENDTVVYERLQSVDELPFGYADKQDGGSYRLTKRDGDSYFGYSVGPHSWKRHLHLPTVRLWQANRNGTSYEIVGENHEAPKLAFLGVRSCDIHAIAILDRVLMGGEFVDDVYRSRRENVFIVAVHCGRAGGTCFCASMNTGPRASFGYDLALTEVVESGRHFFVLEIGTDLGDEVLQEVPHRQPKEEELATAERIVERAAEQMGRNLDVSDIKELLYRNYEHPRWTDVASRCLTCANCTMVCPTCFCTTVEDVSDLSGAEAERWRRWDSCFNRDFSYIHGGSVRSSPLARYRQWMIHKLATWVDQFGTSGCVGCGRCITWCPAAIDITEEVRAIRESEPPDDPSISVKEEVNGNP